jgi:hypothetical protein
MKHCPKCNDVTAHNAVERPGSKLLAWVCSICGTNNGAM